jgi:protein-tyrosine phosphatase
VVNPRCLDWPGCANARDIGGLPTVDGGYTATGALVRSDSPHDLTDAGVAEVDRYGVSRIIDLRNAEEAAAQPGPFAEDPRYRLLPLIDPAAEAARDKAAEPTLAAVYRGSIERNARYIAAGVAAIADAPPGAVLVHCAAGKDRTGMTVALALKVADVTEEAIAADYADTATCEPETITEMLHSIEERHGSVNNYLSKSGLSKDQIKRLRNRLRDEK